MKEYQTDFLNKEIINEYFEKTLNLKNIKSDNVYEASTFEQFIRKFDELKSQAEIMPDEEFLKDKELQDNLRSLKIVIDNLESDRPDLLNALCRAQIVRHMFHNSEQPRFNSLVERAEDHNLEDLIHHFISNQPEFIRHYHDITHPNSEIGGELFASSDLKPLLVTFGYEAKPLKEGEKKPELILESPYIRPQSAPKVYDLYGKLNLHSDIKLLSCEVGDLKDRHKDTKSKLSAALEECFSNNQDQTIRVAIDACTPKNGSPTKGHAICAAIKFFAEERAIQVITTDSNGKDTLGYSQLFLKLFNEVMQSFDNQHITCHTMAINLAQQIYNTCTLSSLRNGIIITRALFDTNSLSDINEDFMNAVKLNLFCGHSPTTVTQAAQEVIEVLKELKVYSVKLLDSLEESGYIMPPKVLANYHPASHFSLKQIHNLLDKAVIIKEIEEISQLEVDKAKYFTYSAERLNELKDLASNSVEEFIELNTKTTEVSNETVDKLEVEVETIVEIDEKLDIEADENTIDELEVEANEDISFVEVEMTEEERYEYIKNEFSKLLEEFSDLIEENDLEDFYDLEISLRKSMKQIKYSEKTYLEKIHDCEIIFKTLLESVSGLELDVNNSFNYLLDEVVEEHSQNATESDIVGDIVVVE